MVKSLKERIFSRRRYVIAVVLTILVFASGLMLGLVIENKRVSYLENLYQKQQIDFSSTQLQYLYLTTLNKKDLCGGYYRTFDVNLSQLDDARIKLVNYAINNKINKENFDSLKRQYTIEQLKYWLFAQQIKDTCGEEFARVLYFYSTNEECQRCADQEDVMKYLKKRFNEKLLIFALDSKMTEEPMITTLKREYSVSVYPTLIIENKKLEGFADKDLILANICPQYTSNITDCAGVYEKKN